ncbi:hypothetical protein [Hoeflea poritis]|uniref:Uncharacterized protein n=1 Tax=Hoeflea poritis TaxID=2993659 RepID=A0ABT4VV67_9HYPH|nr:hypothetical protein [Hoeflea poritis]MDA4848594.1 hypothetical protein [Hoeflea poritis]
MTCAPQLLFSLQAFLFVSPYANADTNGISSSFTGLEFDISGVSLDIPAERSLKALNPNFRFKTKHWKDSQNQKVREDIADQSFATGNIMGVREGVRIIVTPWHSGNLIQQVTRQVSIKPDDQKPTIDDFVAATKAKYGEPSQIITKGIFGRQPRHQAKCLLHHR